MLPVIFIIIIASLISLYEIPRLLKKELKKEIFIYSLLLIIAVGLGILYSLDIKIPNPLEGLTSIYKPINKLIEKYL